MSRFLVVFGEEAVDSGLQFNGSTEKIGLAIGRSISRHFQDVLLIWEMFGGRPGRVELLTGIAGASSRPVRKIIVLDG